MQTLQRRNQKNAVNDFDLQLEGKLGDGEFDIIPIEKGIIVVLKKIGISFILNSTPSGELKPVQRFNNKIRKWENLVIMNNHNLAKIKKLAIEKTIEDDSGSIAWLKRQNAKVQG